MIDIDSLPSHAKREFVATLAAILATSEADLHRLIAQNGSEGHVPRLRDEDVQSYVDCIIAGRAVMGEEFAGDLAAEQAGIPNSQARYLCVV